MNALWSRLNSSGGAIIQNLGACDVKVEGMCCYFPAFCDPIAKCISQTPSSLVDLPNTFPRCSCPDGYQGDGRKKGTGCKNIDECESGLAMCAHTCIDLIPGFRCECMEGYRLEADGRSCRDIDECAEHTDACTHICRNTQGGYYCECPAGFVLSENGRTCIDIDECAEAVAGSKSICPYQELCVNTVGDYECGCPPGFRPVRSNTSGMITCEDVDECYNNANACPHGREQDRVTQICENIRGGHLCRCLPGLAPSYRTPLSPPATRRRLVSPQKPLNIGPIQQRLIPLSLVRAPHVVNDADEKLVAPEKTATDEAAPLAKNALPSESAIITSVMTRADEVPIKPNDALTEQASIPLRNSAATKTAGVLIEHAADRTQAPISRDQGGAPLLLPAPEAPAVIEGAANKVPSRVLSEHPLNKYDALIDAGAFEFGRKGAAESETPEPRRLGVTATNESEQTGEMPLADVLALKAQTRAVLSENEGQTQRLSLEDLRSRYEWSRTQRESLHCNDIDECKVNAGVCGSEAKCINTFRSFSCECNEQGLRHDPTTQRCRPDAAIAQTRTCPPSYCGGPCVMTANGYYCGCPRGTVATHPEKWPALSEALSDVTTEAQFQAEVAKRIQCVDIDECAISAHVCGVGCGCENTNGGYRCICPSSKERTDANLDEDYDILLDISNQFSEAVRLMEPENEIIRVMNRNNPRHTVMALASLKPIQPYDAIRFNVDRWLIDQVDWSSSEFVNLPPDYESELGKLISSEHLVRDFVRTTAAAIRRASLSVCLKSDPCKSATCPSAKPCCLSSPDSSATCLPPLKNGILFNRSSKPRCPDNTVLIPH